MATLVVTNETIVVTCGKRALAARFQETELQVLEPSTILEVKTDVGDEEKSHESGPANACILGADLSRCNKWLALSCSRKELSLWETRSWSLVSNRHLTRSAAKVRFTPTANDVIVADKAGDAYTYSVNNPHKKGMLLLGHLSMLLDVLVSDDEQYIITCDRDEKIRVSHFPNAYNIQSYCLGHTEFVSCLSFLPHSRDILVSGSGDGFVKFWDYVSGKSLYEICCHQYETNSQSNPKSDDKFSTPDEKTIFDHKIYTEGSLNACSDSAPAVMHMSCCVANSASLIAVNISSFKGCIIFRVSGDKNRLASSVMQVLRLSVEPWGMQLSQEGFLWYLSVSEDKPLSVMHIGDGGESRKVVECSDEVSRTLSVFNKYGTWFRDVDVTERMCVLYKRKFDNVGDYLEKKKARLTPSIS